MTETKRDGDNHAAQKLQQRNIDPKLKERLQAEHELVGEFISIIGTHHERIAQQRRQAEDMIKQQQQQQQQGGSDATMSRAEFQAFVTTTLANTPQLTEMEQRVLSRTYYQNWNAGLLAGATTFGLLMGFSHWSARRLAVRRGILPPPPKKSYTTMDHPPPPQHQHYKPSATSSSKSRSNNNAQFQQMDVAKKAGQQQHQSWATDPSSVFASSSSSFLKNNFQNTTAAAASATTNRAAVAGDESVMPQIQLMVYGGLAIVVTILTSWVTIDNKQFFHELAKLPLAPGKSHLCHGTCPEVVQKYQNLMAMKTSTTSSTPAATSAASPEGEHHKAINPASILKDPMTEEAEAMARLVINCQQRIQYEKDHQDNSNNNGNANEVEVVDVPKPGVPSNYSGISVRVGATP